MARLSITRAWSEAAAFVKARARIVFPLAFLLVALPIAAMEAIMPGTDANDAANDAPLAGPWLALALLAMLMGLAGNLALNRLALAPSLSVREALGRAIRRFPTVLAAMLLLIAAAVALLLLIAVAAIFLFGGGYSDIFSPSAALPRATLFILAVALPILCWLSARLMPLPAVAMAEPGGPFSIISRSWRLSSGHGLALVAVTLLILIVATVLRVAIEIVFGSLAVILAGSVDPGSPGALSILALMAAMNCVLAVYIATLTARIYAQLAQARPAGGD